MYHSMYELNFDVNHMDNDLNTPLVYAAARHNSDAHIAHFLLENGCESKPRGEGGGSIELLVAAIGKIGSLWSSVAGNNTHHVRLLLEEYQADPNFNIRRAHEEEQQVDTDVAEHERENPQQWRSPWFGGQLNFPGIQMLPFIMEILKFCASC